MSRRGAVKQRVGRAGRRAAAWADAARPDTEFESRIVWILGSPRSGSTWLLNLLGEHDAVVPMNEPLIGWYLGPFLVDLPAWQAADLHSGNFTLQKVMRDNKDQFFADEFADTWRPALGELIRARFREHVRRYPADAPARSTLLLVKEPNGSQSADLFMPAVPKSRFLFLLRDGRDVVDSELAANRKGAWASRRFPGAGGLREDDQLDFVVQSARKWLWRTEVVESAFAAHPGPKLLMRYEDILADTESHLRTLLDWLGLEMDDAHLHDLIGRHAFEGLPAEMKGPAEFNRAASPGLWRQNLTEREQEAMGEVLGAKVRELGYD
jgi:hypothetical protein